MSTIPPNKDLPIGVTMGCPAGIGPEIILKYFGDDSNGLPPAVVIGDITVLHETAERLGAAPDFYSWPPGGPLKEKAINVLEVSTLTPGSVIPGHPTTVSGSAMASYIDRAITLCLDGTLTAITTCPISKSTLNDAGFNFPGHTEMLAQRTGVNEAVMMMAGSKLKVILATIHCPLASVPAMISKQKLVELVQLTNRTLKRDFNISQPTIAVAALNPHAGEELLFGTEEQKIITPAVEDSRREGIRVTGPYPADTVFYRAVTGEFDAVVCMYHDQGLIPFKLLHFSDGVNVTLGLPIVRTSVDHGTAYDIAGKGLADYQSLKAAVTMASMIAQNRRNVTI